MVFAVGLLVFFQMALLHAIAQDDIPVPEFESSEEMSSSAGHVRLVWGVPDDVENLEAIEFELQQTRDVTFEERRTIYSGPDQASFISGLPDGKYYFRVRTKLNGEVSSWSAHATVDVQHHSLNLAYTLLGLGAIVVIATISVVILGNRRVQIE